MENGDTIPFFVEITVEIVFVCFCGYTIDIVGIDKDVGSFICQCQFDLGHPAPAQLKKS